MKYIKYEICWIVILILSKFAEETFRALSLGKSLSCVASIHGERCAVIKCAMKTAEEFEVTRTQGGPIEMRRMREEIWSFRRNNSARNGVKRPRCYSGKRSRWSKTMIKGINSGIEVGRELIKRDRAQKRGRTCVIHCTVFHITLSTYIYIQNVVI